MMFSRLIDKISPPSSGEFFLQLKALCVEVQAGARMLQAAQRDGTLGTPIFAAQIHSAENRADTITERILLAIRHTMIHPVDPDDLRMIADSLDSVFDTMDHFSWKMDAYRLKPSNAMAAMIGHIVEMTDVMAEMFNILCGRNVAVDALDEKYRRLSDLERICDRIYHESVREIHTGGERAFTVDEEVLATLEDCSDKCKIVGQEIVVMLERNR